MANEQNQPKYKVSWDEENKIIRAQFFGDVDEVTMKRLIDEQDKIIKERGLKAVRILHDASTSGAYASTIRKLSIDWVKKMIASYGANFKMAVHSMSARQRVMAQFVDAIIKTEDFKAFKTEEEALKWLKED